jgi:hypothetical protein
MPEIEVPSHLVLGTKATKRKAEFQVFSEAEVEAILANLPVMAKGNRAPVAFPVRARFEIAWETALRPATARQASDAPTDYRKGGERRWSCETRPTRTRFGRELPLTEREARGRRSIRFVRLRG